MKLVGQTVENSATQLPDVDVLGMVVTEINRASAARSGMELAAGLIVKMVTSGGMADRAGSNKRRRDYRSERDPRQYTR